MIFKSNLEFVKILAEEFAVPDKGITALPILYKVVLILIVLIFLNFVIF